MRDADDEAKRAAIPARTRPGDTDLRDRTPTEAAATTRPRGRVALLVLGLLALVVPLVAGAAPADAAPALTPTTGSTQAADDDPLWYFWGDGCPACAQAAEWLDELEEEYPDLEVRRVEVWYDEDARELFERLMAARGESVQGVPTFVLGERTWVGFAEPLAEEIEGEVARAVADAPAEPPDDDAPAATAINLGPLGTIDVSAQPMAASTALIALVDGFNPCSLWVLTVLLAMILPTRSRTRIAAVGGTFLLVTAAVYGVFIAGVFAAFAVVAHMGWIRVVVALIALGFAAVNLKDFFAFGRGVSLSIPDRVKPRIYRGGRELRRTDRSLPATLGVTVLLAGGVALVELPCTAGFPVLWSNLLAETGVAGTTFGGLLLLYLLVYLLVEVAILTGALVTLRSARVQESHGRALKLVAGTVMAAVAVALLVDPSIMERLTGAFALITGALAAAGAIYLGDRWWRARQPA